VSIVFVTPESAMMKRFRDYLEMKRATAQLDRVVIDEGHCILEGSREFRPKLRELGQLTLVGVQMVYLTATLPPSREEELFSLIYARPREVLMIRTGTCRGNIAYSVLRAAKGGQGDELSRHIEAVRRVLDGRLREYPWPAKMIVYCQSIEQTKAVAAELGCDAYYREIDTRDGKAARLQQWIGDVQRELYGEGRVIMATNALGLGIDIPNIRVVLHLGMPREMVDYAQQSGRARRDGNPSEAIVLRTGGWAEPGAGVGSGADPGWDFLCGRQCRRVVLDRVMDGREDRAGCEDGEEACDVCRGERDDDGLAYGSGDELEDTLVADESEGMESTSKQGDWPRAGGEMECEAERTVRMLALGREAAEQKMVGESRAAEEELYLFRQRLEAVAALGCYCCYVTC
jgi:hypothetical protein